MQSGYRVSASLLDCNRNFINGGEMIKVLLWDVDGTVLDFLAAENKAIKKCFEIFNLGTCTDEMIKVYSSINKKKWEMLERGEKTKPQILVERFEEFFELYNIDKNVANKFNDEYQIRLGDTVVYKDGAKETIEQFEGNYIQCAVTNGTKVAQAKKLNLSGLDQIFDYIFISEDIGYEKPNVEFFNKVKETIGYYKDEEIMIIGDSLTSDIRGGNNAHIKTCFYNPEHKEINADVHIDYIIDNFKDLKRILGE